MWGIVALGVLLVVQTVLQFIALADLYRRPAERLNIANKWVWFAIILFGQSLGSIVYLAVGRKPAPVTEVASSVPAVSRAARAADALYGARKGDKTR